MRSKTIWLAANCLIVAALLLAQCAPAVSEEEEEEVVTEEVIEEEVQLKPAEFKIESLAVSPTEVTTGRSCTATVEVTNISEVAGEYEVILKVNDEIAETKVVNVDAGVTETISFTLYELKSGTYTIGVEGLTETLVVEAPFKVEEGTIRAYARDLNLDWGTVIRTYGPARNDDLHENSIGNNFNVLIPENGMFMVDIQPTRGVWKLRKMDKVVELAEANDMKIRGHPLVWGYDYREGINIGEDWTPFWGAGHNIVDC